MQSEECNSSPEGLFLREGFLEDLKSGLGLEKQTRSLSGGHIGVGDFVLGEQRPPVGTVAWSAYRVPSGWSVRWQREGALGWRWRVGGSCPLRSWKWNLWVVRGRELFPWVKCSLKAMWMMPEGRDQVLWGRGVQAPDSHLAALSLSHVIFRTPENLRPCLDYSKKRPHLYNSVCLFSEATLWNPPQYIWPLNHSLSECLFDSGKGFFTENADQSLDRKLLS